MYNHAPDNYNCPFCQILRGEPTAYGNQHEDIVFSNEFVTAFIAARWWRSAPAHVLVVPNEHIENIYDLSDELGVEIHKVTKKVALALKQAYECDGVSTRQHNEPDGGQDVWHYHQHVYPRYNGKDLYQTDEDNYIPTPEERRPYTEKLKAYFDSLK